MSNKLSMSNLSHSDKSEYKYYKRLLKDLDLYGEDFLRKVASSTINYIEKNTNQRSVK